jgi:hypothetical protein
MTNTIPFYRWDPVLFGNSVDPVPIVYIKPSPQLLNFFHINNNVVLVKIQGTKGILDGKTVSAIVRKVTDIPNCRINFFNQTGYYVLILQSAWYGYPDGLGNGIIKGLVGRE